MTRYGTSGGQMMAKSDIDKFTKEAKVEYHYEFVEKYGGKFCERCTRADCLRLQISHIVSVNEAQKTGMAELAFDKKNFELLGHGCHSDVECWSNRKRAYWYQHRRAGISYLDFLAFWHKFELQNPELVTKHF